MPNARQKKRAKKRLQLAQSPTREAKLVILPYRALKRQKIEVRKYPELMLLKNRKKVEKSKQRISQTKFLKKKYPYIRLKNWSLEVAIAFRFLGQQQVNSQSSISEFS